VIRRLLAIAFVLWALGFFGYAIFLPGPFESGTTDAIVVPTGGQGRIDRGLELLREGRAKQLLVSGVDPEVKPGEFAAEYQVKSGLMRCCVTLGFAAVDTKGNAAETAAWIAQHKFSSLRLVTTDWHMRRAALELRSALPDGVVVTEDAVHSEPSLRILFLEYHKLIASFLSQAWPG
jgi:uncharacterized SAM-binding protein YcdF (DUF218 family)